MRALILIKSVEYEKEELLIIVEETKSRFKRNKFYRKSLTDHCIYSNKQTEINLNKTCCSRQNKKAIKKCIDLCEEMRAEKHTQTMVADYEVSTIDKVLEGLAPTNPIVVPQHTLHGLNKTSSAVKPPSVTTSSFKLCATFATTSSAPKSKPVAIAAETAINCKIILTDAKDNNSCNRTKVAKTMIGFKTLCDCFKEKNDCSAAFSNFS